LKAENHGHKHEHEYDTNANKRHDNFLKSITWGHNEMTLEEHVEMIKVPQGITLLILKDISKLTMDSYNQYFDTFFIVVFDIYKKLNEYLKHVIRTYDCM